MHRDVIRFPAPSNYIELGFLVFSWGKGPLGERRGKRMSRKSHLRNKLTNPNLLLLDSGSILFFSLRDSPTVARNLGQLDLLVVVVVHVVDVM
jgi:hypothetical protein